MLEGDRIDAIIAGTVAQQFRAVKQERCRQWIRIAENGVNFRPSDFVKNRSSPDFSTGGSVAIHGSLVP